MSGGIRIGRILGIPFYINPTWFLVLAFVTFSIASSELPSLLPGQPRAYYWVAGLLVGLIFFASLVAHELGHSLVSRAYGIPVSSITLHLFGGVAQITKEVRRAREEFWIAVAGPAVSVLLAVAFWLGSLLLADSAPLLAAPLGLLTVMNVGITLFNMVPGFPLDGGRVLRSIVWGITGNYRKASRVASLGGQLIGAALIVLGLVLAITGADPSGLWLSLVGWFLVNLARTSYMQAIVQDTLERTAVGDVMARLVSVPDCLSLDELFAGYIRTTGMQYYLVTSGDQPVGIIHPGIVNRVPWPLWNATRLTEVMIPVGMLPEVTVGSTVTTALSCMEDHRTELLRAVDHGRTVGLVSREHLARLILKARPAQ